MYSDNLNVRGTNKKEIVGGFFTKVTNSLSVFFPLLQKKKKRTPTLPLNSHSGQKDINAQFEQDKLFLIEYHKKIATSTEFAYKMTKIIKGTKISLVGHIPQVDPKS